VVISSIATADGMLYAALGANGCEGGSCAHEVVRWPAQGPGEREVILETVAEIERLYVFGGELVWTTPVELPSTLDPVAEMKSCRLEACAQTERLLDRMTGQGASVVADEHHLYWLGATEPAPDPSGQSTNAPYNGLIRRVALLTPSH
jgi:hypothetical protein